MTGDLLYQSFTVPQKGPQFFGLPPGHMNAFKFSVMQSPCYFPAVPFILFLPFFFIGYRNVRWVNHYVFYPRPFQRTVNAETTKASFVRRIIIPSRVPFMQVFLKFFSDWVL